MNLKNMLKNSKFSKHLPGLPYLSIPCLLATWLYAPALFNGKTQIHADSISHNISVLEFNRKMIYEGLSPLWTHLLYGGHPYFAEGQGGFLNPLNFIVALFFESIAGQNIYNWLCIMIGALGMYCLCRHFRCSRESSTFGALAVAFSAYWLHNLHNITIAGGLCWLPWTFLCFERWIEKPTFKSAVWLALLVSLLIFSGYPQLLHGAIMYMAISLIPTLFSGQIGSRPDCSLKQYLLTGLAAIIVCIGLTAIQWLPLLELTRLSARRGGVDIAFPCPLPAYLRGFLFTFYGADIKIQSFGILGSASACFIASLSLALKPNHRIIGHMIASVFLIILGVSYATPIFEYLIKFHLAPGLKYFRTVHLYLGISCIGLGLLGCFAIDRIQRQAGVLENQIKGKLIFVACGSVLFLAWTGLVWWLGTDDVSMMTYASFITAYVLLMALISVDKMKWFGHVALILIVIEIITLRIAPFPFADTSLFKKPRLVEYIQSDIRNRDYKILDISNSWGIAMMPTWSPKLEATIHQAFNHLYGSSNVFWNIPTLDANLALVLARRSMIQSKMKSEISGTDSAPPGSRLIDYLGVRFISADAVPKTPGLELLRFDNIIILENKYALPRIQSFTRYEIVNSPPPESLNRIKQIKEPTLILEPPFDKDEGIKGLPVSTIRNIPDTLEILSSTTTNILYRFHVYARQPAWLFIADANYPGWQAQIDGRATPVYSAQVLGKAVLVPAGHHQIIVEFKPKSFMIGFSLTLLTLVVLSAMGIRKIYLKRGKHIEKKVSNFTVND